MSSSAHAQGFLHPCQISELSWSMKSMTSFKQGEGVRYNARDMALVRGARSEIPVVLGSATPSLESAYNVQQGKLVRLSLPTRPTGGTLPPVELIDLRAASAPSDQQRYLSRPVREAITQTLERGEQVIVFLNRRGFSSFVQCTGCGEALDCHQCAISMTWHKRRRMLHCHYCNAVRPLPDRCPACDEPALELLGRGTEKVEEKLPHSFHPRGSDAWTAIHRAAKVWRRCSRECGSARLIFSSELKW